jgi:transcriptional regulator with XRE-family HTH domain
VPSQRSDIGEFLRSRRARIQPADAGLRVYGERRRVPGPRREELAQLAGISADYYVRLEQGRLDNVSDEILDAVARVLRLTRAERDHLYELAGRARNRRVRAEQPLRPSQKWVLDALQGAAAYVIGTGLDLLAWNRLACVLLTVDLDAVPADERNFARIIFLEEGVRDRWRPWEPMARSVVGGLRMHVARHPDDPRMAALVEELTAKSPEFRKWWRDHPVSAEPTGRYGFWHPDVGAPGTARSGKYVRYAAPTPRSAASQVLRSSQSNGGSARRDPSRTGTPAARSRAAMRRPVLPVAPVTSTPASMLVISSPPRRIGFLTCRFGSVRPVFGTGTSVRQPREVSHGAGFPMPARPRFGGPWDPGA